MAALAFPAVLHIARPVHAQTALPAAVNCDVDTTKLALDPQEQAALNQVNAYRAANGAPPLAVSLTLTRAALWKSASMAAGAPVGHDDASRSWSQRLNDCGYQAGTAAENIAAGESTGAATVADWQSSPPHNENLLNPAYTAVGLKRARSQNPSDTYGWYWTMDFGGGMDVPLN